MNLSAGRNIADGTVRQPAGAAYEAIEGHAQGLEEFHMGGGKGDKFVLKDKQHDVKVQVEPVERYILKLYQAGLED